LSMDLNEEQVNETMYFTLTSELAAFHRTGELPERRGDKTAANNAPYGRYRCRDGWIALICVSEAQWERVLETIGRADLKGHPDYSDRVKRHARETEINAMIGDWCRDLPRDEAFAALRRSRVPVAPVRTVADVRNDPHMHERGMLRHAKHPEMGEIVLPAAPIHLSAYPPGDVTFFPGVGAHSAEALCDWLGLSDTDIASLTAEKVI